MKSDIIIIKVRCKRIRTCAKYIDKKEATKIIYVDSIICKERKLKEKEYLMK